MSLRTMIKKAARAARRKPFRVEDWENTVYIAELSSSEMEQLAELSEMDHRRERAIILGLRDDTGAPLFTSDDLDWLKTQPNVVINDLFDAILEFNGTGNTLDDAEKN